MHKGSPGVQELIPFRYKTLGKSPASFSTSARPEGGGTGGQVSLCLWLGPPPHPPAQGRVFSGRQLGLELIAFEYVPLCGREAFKSQSPGEQEGIVNGGPGAKASGVHSVGAWC